MPPQVLIINPWIYDFAAFDLWAKPLGLLYLAAWLRRSGFECRLVDCMDRLHPESGAPARKSAWPRGSGQWRRQVAPTPEPFQGTPRRFARYGLPESVFVRELTAGPKPEVILVTSGMTYWYPGVHLAIDLARQAWPGTPIILGGIYATLCPEHARARSGADLVVTGPGEDSLFEAMAELNVGTPESAGLGSPPQLTGLWPDLELYPRLDFAPLLTSRGCPRRCPYCASGTMYQGYRQRSPEEVLAEIEDRHLRLGLTDFTFFDDALLIGAEDHLLPILEEVVRRGWHLRFHAPNGLHVGLITAETAALMRAAGFQTLRLGLESLVPDRQEALGDKVPPGRFETAMNNLHQAGFTAEQVGVYILYGLPGQPLEEVLITALQVREAGARPYLAEFSPLPGTPMWPEAVAASPFDLAQEPLYHNNSFFPCRRPDFSWDRLGEIKRAAQGR